LIILGSNLAADVDAFREHLDLQGRQCWRLLRVWPPRVRRDNHADVGIKPNCLLVGLSPRLARCRVVQWRPARLQGYNDRVGPDWRCGDCWRRPRNASPRSVRARPTTNMYDDVMAGAAHPSSSRTTGFRILHPPGDDDQPDHPREAEDPGQQDQDRVCSREALGADQPALHEVGDAREPH
jgi:hypothetical protein